MNKQDMEELATLLDDYEHDPSLFVEEVLGVPRDGRWIDGKFFGQTEQQKLLMAAVAKPNSKVSVKAGHGVGKSSVLSWLILWFLTVFRDAKVPCTAPSAHQLEDVLWAEIAKWHEGMLPYFKSQILVKADRIVTKSNPKNEFAVARTARKENPDALQGFHADNILFLIDEAPGVDEKVFEVARGALSTLNARVLMVGNPTQITGYFFESHNKNRDTWDRYTFSCLDSPLVGENYAKDIEAEYGSNSDMYKVRVLGDFPSASIMQLIPSNVVEAAMGRQIRSDAYSHAPIIIGVDVSYFGDDRSVIYKRQGLMAQLMWEGRNVDTTQLATIAARLEDECHADAVNVDLTGWGSGVLDAGRSWGRNWNGVMVGSASSTQACFNKRAEMWWELKKWLEDGGCIPDRKELRDDLVGPQYTYSRASNKIQLERKEDMRKRGLHSPDEGDALALTFSVPVMAKGGLNGAQGRLQFSAAGGNPFNSFTKNNKQFATHNYKLFGR